MKKFFIAFIALITLVGCGTTGTEKSIKIYTRDGASGTREAFESIIGLEDLSTESAETTGNGDMAKQVGENENAIGYVSLTTDFEANNLKAIAYEGVEATIDTVNKKDYKLARPFSYVTREKGDYESEEKEALVLAFIDYLENSKEGKEYILQAGGIVDVNDGVAWDTLKENHPIVNQDNSSITIKTGGSTSVEKTLDAAITSFIPLAGNFKYESHHTGSGDGFKRTLGEEKTGPNAVDIGFASREFSDSEDVSKALTHGVYSLDAVVVVVNKNNESVTNLTQAQLVSIFSGEVKLWTDIK